VANCFDCLNANLCNSCKMDFYDRDSGLSCIACDLKGQKKNGTNDGSGSCIDCPKNCVDCVDKDTCSTCDQNFYLLLPNKQNCVSCSENGTILQKEGDNNNCYDCGPNCQTCQDKQNCQACQTDFYLKAGKCVPCSQERVFPNKITGTCDDCLINCLKCSSGTNCDQCNAGLYFNQNTKTCESCTVTQCKNCDNGKDLCNECYAGWAVENNNKCTACSTGSPNCQFCELKNVTACTQCEPNFTLVPIESSQIIS
jgi:proprotein convertase subtilisin/kexin type 5